MEWQKKAFLGFFVVVLYHWVPKYIQNLGVEEDVYNHQPGNCKFVEGLDSGSEDMHTLPNGLTFISSGMRRYYNQALDSDGRIYLFDFNKPGEKAVGLRLEGFEDAVFTPHGISVYRNDVTGNVTVFVVNHHPEGDRIEKFHYIHERNSLRHVMTFSDNRLTSANDVAAVDEHSFYFTNYLFSSSRFFKNIEIYMLMRWGSIYFWEEGKRPSLVVSRLKQPNGILTSHDSRLVYVSHEGNQELLIFSRTGTDNNLTLLNSFNLNTGLDNLHLSQDGSELWVGSHAVFWKIFHQLSDPEYPAPSQVLRLDLDAAGSSVTRVTEMYANDGSTLKGSSVASFYQGRLLIGTVIHKALLCELYYMDK